MEIILIQSTKVFTANKILNIMKAEYEYKLQIVSEISDNLICLLIILLLFFVIMKIISALQIYFIEKDKTKKNNDLQKEIATKSVEKTKIEKEKDSLKIHQDLFMLMLKNTTDDKLTVFIEEWNKLYKTKEN